MSFAQKGLVRSSRVAVLALAALSLFAGRAQAYKPESPEVKAMVQKGVAYLEKGESMERRLGGVCVIGLACYKATENKNHPKVKEAIAECQRVTAAGFNRNEIHLHYSLGLAIIFLCEVDPFANRKEVEYFYRLQQEMQKDHGGYGYPAGYEGMNTGDTSQTQYGVLANWYVHKYGLDPSTPGIEAVANWLLRTQDPTGGWGYQGNDPGPSSDYALRQQGRVNVSMSAAGLGSLYVCADTLGFGAAARKKAEAEAERERQRNSGLPEELVRVEESDAGDAKPGDNVPSAVLTRALSRGDAWFAKNYSIKHDWQYYYLYALERMHSFREHYAGKEEAEPGWYNDGVKLLLANQRADGAWPNPAKSSMTTDVTTSFAMLFLIRGTQKTIHRHAELSEGEVVGGRGFGTDTGKLRVGANGELEPLPVERSMADLLSILEDPNHPEFASLVQSGQLSLGTDVAARTSHAERLRAIVSTGDYRARRVAVRNLAQSGNLDNVPIIIYALSDPDWRVSTEARDGLRFISRKFEGFGLPVEASAVQKREAQRKWAEWYKSIRPDGELLGDYSE